ncbi:5-oxoprolinase subunit C family protein [Aestuariivivens insulae]|uniref:5-oxoprolinase subunit C family protein n=1 Tax=Aestuariivivens insulae TaxID=1621988 RepID=UPI001F58FC31|nr:biotin-dependent carboxyltransferase family protein [Aestuariivivens insulae]
MVKVLQPGFYSSIQDLGRYGYQNYGVPLSGVMDRYASTIANTLLGNTSDSPVLEITMAGPILEFCTSTLICISGANMEPALNKTPIQNNKALEVKRGDVLSFGKLNCGFRAYLAVLGGFQTASVMGSFSMYQGITNQISIGKGDELTIHSIPSPAKKRHAVMRVNNDYLKANSLGVFKGPEFDLLSEEQQKALWSTTFTVSKYNNRMAYQLEEPLENTLAPIITSLVLPGTVQLTPSGQLIILMRDCQTTGGYPRILQLKASAIDVLSQKFAGNSINFKLRNI